MQNSGVEITLEATPLSKKDFSWKTSFNIAFNKNKVTKLPDGNFVDGAYFRAVGSDYQSWYTRVWAGVDPANGDPLWYKDSTRTTTTNNYTTAQRVMYGSASPKYFGSFSNSFNYKGFGLDFQFYFNFGNYIRDGWAFYTLDGVSASGNKYKYELQRWQKPGDITDVPKYVYNSTNNSTQFSTRQLYKGDFIRLKNITFSYNLPRSVLQRLKIASAMFYVRGFNLFTKTYDDRLVMDPEAGVTSSTNLQIPIDKTITAGLSLEF
jgi:hypothetical protein